MRRLSPVVILVVTCAVFAPTFFYDWVIAWDDAALFAWNPHVRAWSWWWMLTTTWYGHWMPLTWLSASATYALFGYHASAWHAVNVALHAISAVLIYCIALRLLGGGHHLEPDQCSTDLTRAHIGAVFAALVWALHPLRMESVAWVTERKDVLMGVFFLGAALLWLQGRRGWAFTAFVAACLSKSPAVLLPVWLLTLDWYLVEPIKSEFDRPSRFWLMLFRPLLPFFAVSLAVSIMAFHSLHTIAVSMPWSSVPLGPRLLHVAYSEVFYAWQTIWPQRLSALIEYTWAPSWDQSQYPIAVALCVVGAVLVWITRRRAPALIACAVAYTVAVLPQSGIFQNGPQLVANRYSYLACLPLAFLAGGVVTLGSRRLPRLVPAAAAGVVLALTAVTLHALPMWKNSDAMWQYAALHEPTCTQCQDMATVAEVRQGNLDRAIWYQQRAIRVSDTTMLPRWERHWNLAALLLAQGRDHEAIQEIRTYLAAVPESRRDTEADRDHMDRARAVLARLEAETIY